MTATKVWRTLAVPAAAGLVAVWVLTSRGASVSETVTDGSYQLVVTLSPGSRRATDALDVQATLTYLGPEATTVVTASDLGLVSFSFQQLDGSLRMDPVSRLMCSSPTTLTRREPATFRPVKSIAYVGEDPNAEFYRAWYEDPVLHLPRGRWQIVAQSTIYDGTTCIASAPSHQLTSPPLVFDVVP
jgi:hypothetical protein